MEDQENEKVKSYSLHVIYYIARFAERNKHLVITVFTTLFMVFLIYLSIKQINRRDELLKTIRTEQTIGYIASYKNDMGFLDCIAEQHSCLFKNLKSNSYELIMERCKNEDFCAAQYTSGK